MKKLNWNTIIKVKLNAVGKEIFFKSYNREPNCDDNGYYNFQLWWFMFIYGQYIRPGAPDVVEHIEFYIDEEDLENIKET